MTPAEQRRELLRHLRDARERALLAGDVETFCIIDMWIRREIEHANRARN